MPAQAVRGMSAPPEVVYNTATDPDRSAAWLPESWRAAGSHAGDEEFEVRLSADAGADRVGLLQVRAGAAGGSSVELTLDAQAGADGRTTGPEQLLDSLEREVVDNFNYG